MDKLKQRIDELSAQFSVNKKTKNLRQIIEGLHVLSNQVDITHIEKIVLLINECIVLDELNHDNIEINKIRFSRSNIVEQIKTLYEEFISSTVIDQFETDSTLLFKEQISCYIALLLCKVHDYADAYYYFKESKKFSKKINNSNSPILKSQIKRDIHFAYCCEYIGTPKMDCEKLVEALKLLLGNGKDAEDADTYWCGFKEYCYRRRNDLESILASGKTQGEKVIRILEFLTVFGEDESCILATLIKISQEKGKEKDADIEVELSEAVHVLAHCLNEINQFFVTSNFEVGNHLSDEDAIDYLKRKNLIKMIARILIDSLGERYETCQATIRAEQGNGVDAILKMHNRALVELKPSDHAELDFYLFYFETLFSDKIIHYHNEHVHGAEFLEYCKKNYNNNPDNYKDGLLHYYVVLLRKELKNYLKEIISTDDKNMTFFQDDRKMCQSGFYDIYEELRKNEFSSFVNSQMVLERDKLIIIYKILRSFQENELPLFYEPITFYNDLKLTESFEELYHLCKKFNEYSKTGKELTRSDERPLIDLDTQTAIISVDGLRFEFYGNMEEFGKCLQKCFDADCKIIDIDNRKDFVKNKILYFDDADNCRNCYTRLLSGNNLNGKDYHIFYVGEYDSDNEYRPIAAFKSIDICFLMAYVYGTIEHVLDDIFNPKPIYILTPLRNVSNFEFQEAKFDSLLRLPNNYVPEIEIKRGGIGLKYQNNSKEDDCFEVTFCNDDVKEACICLVKLYEEKLYVLREGKLVHKPIHIKLVNSMYEDYAVARKVASKQRHKDCKEKQSQAKQCVYFYNQITNNSGFSKTDQKSATKLLYFLHIACEEQISLDDQCYLLQLSFMEDTRDSDKGFQICIFDRDIAGFLEDDICLKKIVAVKKLASDLASDTVASVLSSTNDIVSSISPELSGDGDERKRVLESIELLLAQCEENKSQCELHQHNDSLARVEEILKKIKELKSGVAKGYLADMDKARVECVKLKEELCEVYEGPK